MRFDNGNAVRHMKNPSHASPLAITPGTPVFDAAGQPAEVIAGEQDKDSTEILLQRPRGKPLRVPREMLSAREDGSYLLPIAFSSLEEMALSAGERHVVLVIREELQVGKRVIDTGRGIRVHSQVVERTEVVDEPLQEDVLELTRVPVGRMIDDDAMPAPRQEGETLIVPELEEVLVVERRLRVKEELHITRHKREVHAPQSVVLKSQQVTIERFDEKKATDGTTTLSNLPKQDTNNPGMPAR